MENGVSGRGKSKSTGTEASKWLRVFGDTWNLSISNIGNCLSRWLKVFLNLRPLQICSHKYTDRFFFNPLSYDGSILEESLIDPFLESHVIDMRYSIRDRHLEWIL